MQVKPGTVGTLATLPASGVIAPIGVLEQLVHPRDALTAIHHTLHDNGLVFLEVPDAERFAACQNAPSQQFSTEHIGFYTQAGLHNLLRIAGFRPMTWDTGDHEWQQDLFEPFVRVLARRQPGAQEPDAIQPETASSRAVERYIDSCAHEFDHLCDQILGLAKKGPYYIWGAGTHTLRLLRKTALGDLNIRAFIDRNWAYTNKTLHGHKFVEPSPTLDGQTPIVVRSYVFRYAISQLIRELGLQNQVIHLDAPD